MSLGTWIQNERRQAGLSVTELATESGLSYGSIRAYEQGRRMPSVQAMNKLLVALDFQGAYWTTPTTWKDPVTGQLYDFARYPGDNRNSYHKEIPVDGPLLGLATTEELFRELMARFTTSQRVPGAVENALVLAEMLGGLGALDREYRTAEPIEQEPEE